ncbi:hypothetical protein RF11_05742 [Thelohanellus kitauei]|uniref:Uncharacterized protein n=1 Tax=Thelohanellus kitauei TaxID=669202 RepID=A0A0C2NJR5_THEKT|nr:hypothetical protein RF11_05742 [Thelohanellus kitauei]
MLLDSTRRTAAWQQVSKSIISNCLVMTKFIKEEIQTEAHGAELIEVWEGLHAQEEMHENKDIEFSDFLGADERLSTSTTFKPEEIEEEILCSEEPVETEDDVISVEEEVVSFDEVQSVLFTMLKFM